MLNMSNKSIRCEMPVLEKVFLGALGVLAVNLLFINSITHA